MTIQEYDDKMYEYSMAILGYSIRLRDGNITQDKFWEGVEHSVKLKNKLVEDNIPKI